jgi:hypothetical protein
MESHMKIRLERLYNKHGIDETLKFIFYSKKVPYIEPTINISKVIELVSLSKGERSIVRYLNYLEDKNRTIMASYRSNCNDATNGAKMSKRQIKHMETTIKSISSNKLNYLKSFVGALELNKDGLGLERATVKARKIKSLYVAKIPLNNINIKDIVESLNSRKIKSSEQDILAFLSLIVELSYGGEDVNIPRSFWESLFGENHIKTAKEVFQNFGVLQLVSKYITGFKSAGYKLNLWDTSRNDKSLNAIDLKITSIRTLERLNRIKKYKGAFTFTERPEALRLITDLKLKEIRMSGPMSATTVFLESGRLHLLIDDFEKMLSIINNKRHYKIAASLGIHLNTYFNTLKKNDYQDYRPFFFEKDLN